MKTRNRVLIGIGGFFALAIGTLMAVTAHDSPCPAPTPLAEASADTMRSIAHRCYKIPEGLALVRKPIPMPKEGQVLIKVHASSVNPAEWYGASGQPLWHGSAEARSEGSQSERAEALRRAVEDALGAYPPE